MFHTNLADGQGLQMA